jgi:hypothetical protein
MEQNFENSYSIGIFLYTRVTNHTLKSIHHVFMSKYHI